MLVIALLLQAAPAAAPVTRASATPPDRFSILLPDCPAATGRDVVVCGANGTAAQRLPYPEEVVLDQPKPSNPYLRATGALAAEATPCAATQWGCPSGFGPPIVPAIVAGVKGIKNALANGREARARARDGDRRQPIDLAAAAPTGHVEP